MGCWSTLSSYLRFLPSRVVRVVKLCVSLGTTVKLGLCSMTGYKARLELGSVDGARIEAAENPLVLGMVHNEASDMRCRG